MNGVWNLDQEGGRAVPVLLHVCCGPCSLMSVLGLRLYGLEVSGFFYNPNIHPREEYELRRQAMLQAAACLNLPMRWEPDLATEPDVDPETWLVGLGSCMDFGERCLLCYAPRLERTARLAADLGYPAFSTSLLYSRYQQHERIMDLGGQYATKYGLVFAYSDLRRFWRQGIDLSKQLGLYRQKWCGCVLSRDEAAGTSRTAKGGRV